MWPIGGIESEHILVIGVTKQCPAEGFLPKKVRPAQWPVQWKIFAPNRGGVYESVRGHLHQWTHQAFTKIEVGCTPADPLESA